MAGRVVVSLSALAFAWRKHNVNAVLDVRGAVRTGVLLARFENV